MRSARRRAGRRARPAACRRRPRALRSRARTRRRPAGEERHEHAEDPPLRGHSDPQRSRRPKLRAAATRSVLCACLQGGDGSDTCARHFDGAWRPSCCYRPRPSARRPAAAVTRRTSRSCSTARFSGRSRAWTSTLDAEIAVDGLEGFDKPIRIQASGPYRCNEGKLPSFDLDLDLSAGGPASTISTGRLSTGDRAFVKFGETLLRGRSRRRSARQPPARLRGRRDAAPAAGSASIRGRGSRTPRTRATSRSPASTTTHVSGTPRRRPHAPRPQRVRQPLRRPARHRRGRHPDRSDADRHRQGRPGRERPELRRLRRQGRRHRPPPVGEHRPRGRRRRTGRASAASRAARSGSRSSSRT